VYRSFTTVAQLHVNSSTFSIAKFDHLIDQTPKKLTKASEFIKMNCPAKFGANLSKGVSEATCEI